LRASPAFPGAEVAVVHPGCRPPQGDAQDALAAGTQLPGRPPPGRRYAPLSMQGAFRRGRKAVSYSEGRGTQAQDLRLSTCLVRSPGGIDVQRKDAFTINTWQSSRTSGSDFTFGRCRAHILSFVQPACLEQTPMRLRLLRGIFASAVRARRDCPRAAGALCG
jgi:hypothetical protein